MSVEVQFVAALVLAGIIPALAQDAAQRPLTYQRVAVAHGATIGQRFSADQLALIEKLNRRDLAHMVRLKELVVPSRWDLNELAYCQLPAEYPSAASAPKFLVVHQPSQVFGAYDNGRLARWGPVSTGRKSKPTPSGLFFLNWRSPGRTSTVDPTWFMRWYFNFDNRRGLSLHEYDLPGLPESHACVRLLARDARWLFDWGEEWQLDDGSQAIARNGTPVLVVGAYAFGQPPPWQDIDRLAQPIDLPATAAISR